mgnify:CR=1 FL=1
MTLLDMVRDYQSLLERKEELADDCLLYTSPSPRD